MLDSSLRDLNHDYATYIEYTHCQTSEIECLLDAKHWTYTMRNIEFIKCQTSDLAYLMPNIVPTAMITLAQLSPRWAKAVGNGAARSTS